MLKAKVNEKSKKVQLSYESRPNIFKVVQFLLLEYFLLKVSIFSIETDRKIPLKCFIN